MLHPATGLAAEEMKYLYTQQLKRLASFTDMQPERTLLPPELQGNPTHINLEVWKEQLEHHPDKEFTSLIINRLHLGFMIGFDPDSPLKSATCNLISTTDHEEVHRNNFKKPGARLV